MRRYLIPVVAVAIALAGVSQLGAGQGCCGTAAPAAAQAKSGCSMTSGDGCGSHDHSAASKAGVLPAGGQAVLDSYFKVQSALALDSFESAREGARALETALRQDSDDTFPAALYEQVTALVKLGDLAKAREAFKPVSQTLLAHLKTLQLSGGVYREAHCPMAKASWAQTGNTLMNPFMGKSMPHCGQFKS